jgi:DNA-binding CsgD family transcriptional regulator
MNSTVVLLGPPAPCRFIRPIPAAGPCLLGRSARCDLIVDDPSVSRWHAQLSLDGGFVRVADLGSRNGTFVDDEPVREAAVAPGRRLRFGDVPFLLTRRDALDGGPKAGGTPAGHRPSPLRPDAARLTGAQQTVFDFLVQGLSEKAIARRLVVSAHTVHAHVGAIYKAFHVHSRSELLAHVLRQRAPAAATDTAPPAERPRLLSGPPGGGGPAATLRLFYISPEERDDFRRVLDGLGVAFRDAGGFLQVDGALTPVAMRAVTAVVRTNLRLG